MSNYRDKVDPTPEGLDELDESTRYATIERLIAAIQHKHLKPEEVIDLTQHFRNRQSIEEKELFRLGDAAVGYNRKWATNYNGCFSREQMILDKRQSQYKSWREMLNATTPRFKRTPRDSEDPQSVYKKSFLTHQPYERDMWGPASYGRLVYDLWETIDTTIQHLDEGRELCKDMISEEQCIDKDPKRKEQLFWEQYYEEVERNKDTIEYNVQKGIANIDHPEYKKMLTYPDMVTGYAVNNFHKPSETGFSGFVLTNESLVRQKNKITHTETQLFGRNPERIKRMRFLIDHLEELLSANGQRFDKIDTMCFIKWCNVNKSKKRKDNEHVLFNYISERRKGLSQLRLYGWPCLFELRKYMDDAKAWERPVGALNKRVKELWEKYNDGPWEAKEMKG